MKTLIVFHRLMRDGSNQVINELRYKSSIFNLRRFADMSSPEGNLLNKIKIQKIPDRSKTAIFVWYRKLDWFTILISFILAHHQSLFVRKYSQYLEEKVLVYKILGLEFEKEFQNTKNYTTEELFERIPRLQSQLNALLNCRVSAIFPFPCSCGSIRFLLRYHQRFFKVNFLSPLSISFNIFSPLKIIWTTPSSSSLLDWCSRTALNYTKH